MCITIPHRTPFLLFRISRRFSTIPSRSFQCHCIFGNQSKRCIIGVIKHSSMNFGVIQLFRMDIRLIFIYFCRTIFNTSLSFLIVVDSFFSYLSPAGAKSCIDTVDSRQSNSNKYIVDQIRTAELRQLKLCTCWYGHYEVKEQEQELVAKLVKNDH